MPTVHIDKVGEMAIIECAGRFVALMLLSSYGMLLRPKQTPT
jgi:hypothetical protein